MFSPKPFRGGISSKTVVFAAGGVGESVPVAIFIVLEEIVEGIHS